MAKLFFRLWQFCRFYSTAVTKYQLHSPFVFELAETVLDSHRLYYAFIDIERMRDEMLKSREILQLRDFGTGKDRPVLLKTLAGRAASSPGQGQMLFRLANWANPQTILELGTSIGIGAMYLKAGAGAAQMITLEGCPSAARTARANLELLGIKNKCTVMEGSFEKMLPVALDQLKVLDFVFFDGNHREEPTLEYFEQCLKFSHEKTVFVFDDVHWSSGMKAAWLKIQQHPNVTLTLDFFDLSLAFINPDFKQKQHLNIVPSRWKIWKFL